MPDSDASTVPAKTEDAKRMAIEKTREAKARELQVTPPCRVKTQELEELSSKPKLTKEIQSKPVLEPEASKVATAVKAKAAPPVVKEEAKGSLETSQAVQDCLRRPSTTELSSPAPPSPPKRIEKKPEKEKTKESKDTAKTKEKSAGSEPTPVASAPPGPPDSDSESSDSEEDRKKEAQAKAKREAHARYMRFSRSLTSSLV